MMKMAIGLVILSVVGCMTDDVETPDVDQSEAAATVTPPPPKVSYPTPQLRFGQLAVLQNPSIPRGDLSLDVQILNNGNSGLISNYSDGVTLRMQLISAVTPSITAASFSGAWLAAIPAFGSTVTRLHPPRGIYCFLLKLEHTTQHIDLKDNSRWTWETTQERTWDGLARGICLDYRGEAGFAITDQWDEWI